MILSAYAIQADVAYIFLRGRIQPCGHADCSARSRKPTQAAISARTSSARATTSSCICTSAPDATSAAKRPRCLNALEGKRAQPAREAAVSAVTGLWGKPTVVNNVETLCNVPHIVNNGAEWFQKAEPHRGRRHQALRRQRPGEAAGHLGAADGHARSARFSRNTRAACATACGFAASCRAAPRPTSSSRSISTCRWTSRRSRRRAAASAPAP